MTSIYEVKGDNAHAIYKWAMNNHGKSAVPKWNFHKILIGKDGKVAILLFHLLALHQKRLLKL